MTDYEKAIIDHLINVLDDDEIYERVVENAIEDVDDPRDFEEIYDNGLLICKTLSERLVNYLENLDKI